VGGIKGGRKGDKCVWSSLCVCVCVCVCVCSPMHISLNVSGRENRERERMHCIVTFIGIKINKQADRLQSTKEGHTHTHTHTG